MSAHVPLSESTASVSTTGAVAASGNYRWSVVAMLWFICFFNYADRQAIASVLPLLEEEFHFSKSELGWIGGAFMIVYGASAPLAGMVGDRWSRKLLILGGLYVWSLVTGMTALCRQFWQFVAVRGAEGLGETFYFPASMSLVSDYHGQETRSRAMALHQTSVYAGIIGGGVGTGWLAQHFGWRFPFYFFGVGGILLGLVLMRWLREPQRNMAELAAQQAKEDEPAVSWLAFVRGYLTLPAPTSLLLAFVGANTVAGVLYVWLPLFVKQKFELNLVTASVVGTVSIQIGAMLGSVTGGVLADAWRQRWLGGRVAVQALGIVAGVPTMLLAALAPQMWLAILGMFCLGFAKGVYDSNIWPSIFEVVPPSRRSSAVGLANLVGWGMGGVGTGLLGQLLDSGVSMSTALAGLAGIYVLVAVLLWVSALWLTPRHLRAEGRDNLAAA